MGKKANPAVIGAFVVGAVALAVARRRGVRLGPATSATPTTFVLYFPGSVNGLSVGAPVKFKGVEIGTVTDIKLVLRARGQNQPEPHAFRCTCETDPSKILVDGQRLEMTDPENVRDSSSSAACAPSCSRRAWSPACCSCRSTSFPTRRSTTSCSSRPIRWRSPPSPPRSSRRRRGARDHRRTARDEFGHGPARHGGAGDHP